MRHGVSFRFLMTSVAVSATVILAGCTKKPEPVKPTPPPAMVVPPKPYPPNGASPTMAIPAADANGLRASVNRNITPAQTTWNLRAAYNVAALNCTGPRHTDILTNYREFLKDHARTLAAANRKVDAEFKAIHGARFVAPREKYMTEVYNHFALPPTLSDFCDAAQAVSRDAIGVKSADLEAFAGRSLPNIEVVFDDFYRRYEQYQRDLADWNAKYASYYAPTPATVTLPSAPPPGTTTPPVVTETPAATATASPGA